MIDWDAVQRKSESTKLAAEEIGALVKLAKSGVSENPGMYGFFCPYCQARFAEFGHTDDCPISVLEEVNNGAD